MSGAAGKKRREASVLQMFTPTFLETGVERRSKPKERLIRALERPTHVLSVSPRPEDHQALRRILKDPPWRITAAGGCPEAIARLTWDRINIVITESSLPVGNWRDLLRRVDEYAEPLTLIVTSALADERLWAEVLNLGGFDVLSKPFNAEEVRHVLAGARDRFVRPITARASGV
jgi:DNA-binding NtrC family response regulator